MKQQDMQIKMQKISAAIQQNQYLLAVSTGLMALIPIMLVGAIFTLLDSIQIAPYQNFLLETGLKNLTSLPLEITTNMFSIYAVFAIAYKFSVDAKGDGFTAGITALMSFLILTPLGTSETGGNALPFDWIGSSGLVVAMLTAIVVSKLYIVIIKKGWYIKMPKGVPPTIEKSFAGLTPGFIIVFIMLCIRGIFMLTPYENIHYFIFSFIQTPLTSIGGSAPGFIFMVFLAHVFWFFGIHGMMIFLAIMQVPLLPLDIENLRAFQAGAPLPNLLITPSLTVYVTVGGSGTTIGLAIAMLRAKAKRYKTLGKLGIVPSIFGINEPIIFGMPLVLNTRFIIPFLATPTISIIVAYILTAIGILPPLIGINVPVGTPIGLIGFIVGGWRVALFQMVIVVFSYFMYLPSFKKADEEAYEVEKQS